MLISEQGETIGSLSGGCLEEEVALEARDVIRSGEPKLLRFDTRKRFGCDGQIEIVLEKIDDQVFLEIGRRLDARQDCVLATDSLGTRIGPPDQSVAEKRLVQRILSAIRVLIVGDGPDTTPLAHLCKVLGWLTIIASDFDLATIAPDDRTAAIVKTHNYGRDFAALRHLLPLNLRYVGLIGPRRRRDQLLNDLLDIGVVINAGFFAPAGLDLHSETPVEIALAIIAEIQRAFAGGTAVALRDRKVSIHPDAPDLPRVVAANP